MTKSQKIGAPLDFQSINVDALKKSFDLFGSNKPFNHVVVDNFLNPNLAQEISDEFINFNSTHWVHYHSPIEEKKALNDWNLFPPLSYQIFSFLNSETFLALLSELTKEHLFADPGLHGAGWHIHGSGGNLNPHLDYSIHPKLGLERKYNIIIYVSKDLREHHGGHLGFWSHDSNNEQPKELITEIAPLFNRAVIFDTTQNAWHGFSRKLNTPPNVYRKSLAIYYLRTPSLSAQKRQKALFAPRDIEKDDPSIKDAIRLR